MNLPDKERFDFEDPRVCDQYQKSASGQPSAAADVAILPASRRAVASRPRAAGPFSGRWQVPTAVAATVLLAVLVIPALHRETSRLAEPELLQSPSPSALERSAAAGIKSH